MRISLDRARTTHAAIDDAIAAFEGKPAPDGVVNLESLHVIVLFFTMVGMLLPVGVSTSVYWISNTSYHEDATLSDGSEYDKYKYTVDGLMLEPFSAWANATYFTAGLGLFLLPFLSGDHMPAAVFGIALFLCILGGSSMSFHADGSRIGTWRHAADRFAMYMPFAYLSVAVWNGLYHACRGRAASPRSVFGLLTNLGALTFAAYCLTFQDDIDSMGFLIRTGFVIFTTNFFAMAALQYHRQSREQGANNSRLRRALHAIARASPALLLRLLCLGVGFWVREGGETYFKKTYEDRSNAAITWEQRLEWRRRHDVMHGTWHLLTAMVLMGMGLTLAEGLSGKLDAPAAYLQVSPAEAPSAARTADSFVDANAGKVAVGGGGDGDVGAAAFLRQYATFLKREEHGELVAMGMCVLLPIIFATLYVTDVSFGVWLGAWLCVVVLYLPASTFLLVRAWNLHTRRVDAILVQSGILPPPPDS